MTIQDLPRVPVQTNDELILSRANKLFEQFQNQLEEPMRSVPGFTEQRVSAIRDFLISCNDDIPSPNYLAVKKGLYSFDAEAFVRVQRDSFVAGRLSSLTLTRYTSDKEVLQQIQNRIIDEVPLEELTDYMLMGAGFGMNSSLRDRHPKPGTHLLVKEFAAVSVEIMSLFPDKDFVGYQYRDCIEEKMRESHVGQMSRKLLNRFGQVFNFANEFLKTYGTCYKQVHDFQEAETEAAKLLKEYRADTSKPIVMWDDNEKKLFLHR